MLCLVILTQALEKHIVVEVIYYHVVFLCDVNIV